MNTLKEIHQFNPIHQLKEYEACNNDFCLKIEELARGLKGRAVWHINTTASGGGVAELLQTQIPFERSLGLDSHWLTIEAPESYFVITKKIHNYLQCGEGDLNPQEKEIYLAAGQEMEESLKSFLKSADEGIVILHDPQPLPLVHLLPAEYRLVARFHLDLTFANKALLEFLKPLVAKTDRVVLSNPEYLPSFIWLNKEKIDIIYPAIDPLAEKNQTMNLPAAQAILQSFGINPSKPIIAQVSRFDKWKDPLGVIQAFYLAKNEIHDLQLVLTDSFEAKDDPEAEKIVEQVLKHKESNPDLFILLNPGQLKDVSNPTFINALYTASTVVVQKSLREGFGLTVTEAMWKGKAVVAGQTSGTAAQITNEVNGFLVSSPQETAEVLIRLINDEPLRHKLGEAAHESVRQKFLLPRYILDHFLLYQKLI